MTGREEHDAKFDEMINNLLDGKPDVLIRYANSSFNSKTKSTKYRYLFFVWHYLEYLEENGYDINSIDTYKDILPSDIDDYISYLKDNGSGNGSAHQKFYAVKSFYTFLKKKMRCITENPCDDADTPHPNNKKEVVFMTPDEVRQVESVIAQNSRRNLVARNLAIFSLGCTTGLRVESIVEINVADLDLEHGSITVVEKGNKERTVYLGRKTINYIRKWLEVRDKMEKEDTDALFLTPVTKKRITTFTVTNMLKESTKCIGKKITPHKMRSTCGTNLYQKTGDIYLVAQVLGHNNIASTKRYAQVDKTKRTNAAKIMNDLF